MRTQLLVGVVVALHAMAIGTLVFMQGCGTTTGGQIERADPPPAPVMPPKGAGPVAPVSPALPPPALNPPPPAPVSVPVVEVGEYVVQSGDAISKIAKKFGVSVRELCELNKITDPNKLRQGQRLIVPRVPGAPAPAPVVPPAAPRVKAPDVRPATVRKVETPKPAAPSVEGAVYEVQPGDSLGKIAKQTGVKVAALREANQLKGDLIRVGQKLTIPVAAASAPAAPSVTPPPVAPAPPASAPAADPVVVPPVPAPAVSAPAPVPEAPLPTPSDLKAPPAPAQPGSPSPAQPATSAQPYRYPATQGETLKQIAKAFLLEPEELAAFNNLPVDAQLKAGQIVLVPVKE